MTDDDKGQGGGDLGTPNAGSAARTRPEADSNVRLAHDKQPITVDGLITIGVHTIKVPSEAQQRAGFRAVDDRTKKSAAHLLVQQYVGVYKAVVPEAAQGQGQQQWEGQNDATAE